MIMDLTFEQAIGQKLLASFAGLKPSQDILDMISHRHLGGISLFQNDNLETPIQVRAMTDALQQAAAQSGQPPLLIGTDQEYGQLVAICKGTTPFPGNMALGATGSDELAYKAGYAIGREVAAMGFNVNYAPVCDVNNNPQNPAIGIRSFGEAPTRVAQLGAAMIRGMQEAGVAATAKHFPGHGDTESDSHYGDAVVNWDESQLRAIGWPPFQSAIEAGVKLVMTAHIALPKLHDGDIVPATLSPGVLGALRRELGFDGVIVTDSMAMQAIAQDEARLALDIVAAAKAGVDLLLMQNTVKSHSIAYEVLRHAIRRHMLSKDAVFASARRIMTLKEWVSRVDQPSLDVVGCADHQALAREIAEKSVTLVRDDAHLLPLRLSSTQRLAVVIPKPINLTPADSATATPCTLPEALRRRHANVSEFWVDYHPEPSTIVDLRRQLRDFDMVLIGTMNVVHGSLQAAMVHEILNLNIPTIMVALRNPYDLQAYPEASTYLCTYNMHSPSMEALTEILWGNHQAVGQLPVSIPLKNDENETIPRVF